MVRSRHADYKDAGAWLMVSWQECLMALLRPSPVPARMLRLRAALTPRPSAQARSLVVGRDPAMQEHALMVVITAPIADLSHAAPRDAFDWMRAKFPTATIAVFEFPGTGISLPRG
jgi:phosphohistidine phosphatase SixA